MPDISHLIADLSSTDLPAKGRAAKALAKLGDEARPAAVPLVREAGCLDETVREWVISALEGLGPPAEEELPALKDLIASPDGEVAFWAITLLGRLEAKAAPAVPELIEALQTSPDLFVRQKAAWALGEIGPAAKEALPALEAAAKSPDRRLAGIAKNHAIKQITKTK